MRLLEKSPIDNSPILGVISGVTEGLDPTFWRGMTDTPLYKYTSSLVPYFSDQSYATGCVTHEA